MIITIIFALFILTIVDFVYNGIIVPSIHLNLRYKLFELRDRIRHLMIDGNKMATDKQYEYLHDGVNNALLLVTRLDLATLFYFYNRLKHDEILQKRIEKRIGILEECKSIEFQKLRMEIAIVLRRSFIANLGLWVFIAPFAIPFLWPIEKKGRISKDVSCVPEEDLAHIQMNCAFSH